LKNKFEIHKDKTHFIFINSQSGILIDSESNFNTTNMKPKRSNTRIGEDIEINQKKKKLSQKEKNYSKEEDLLKKLVLFLVENN
jgi:predicted choloylglycine hydrolase